MRFAHAQAAGRSAQHGHGRAPGPGAVPHRRRRRTLLRRLVSPVTVGIESTGSSLWLHALLQRLGHTLLVGEAAKIPAMVVRKIKTDRRDGRPLRDLRSDTRFPVVWIRDPTTRDLRALIKHRLRLVRIRTMVKNGLHAIALNQ